MDTSIPVGIMVLSVNLGPERASGSRGDSVQTPLNSILRSGEGCREISGDLRPLSSIEWD